ncbi:MAG: cache domain-containing protein [Gammaproteobacteria bacterium]
MKSNRLQVWVIGIASAVLIVLLATMVRKEMNDYTNRVRRAVVTLMELRRGALEQHLNTVRSEVILWSENPTLVEFLTSLREAWDDRGSEAASLLHRQYVLENPHEEGSRLDSVDDGSLYSEVHAAIHPRLRRFLDVKGFYDVFLFDPAGNLIYSAYKEQDFGTNFVDGPWRDTGLGEVFRAAAGAGDKRFVAFADFAPYPPSNDEPASFIASPVYDGGHLLGVLAMQMSVDEINAIMQFQEGMGETGESYIVGSDSLMRSDSRFSDESTILRTTVDTLPVRRAFNGEQGSDVVPDYRDERSISAYGPLDFEGNRWAIVAEIDEAEIRGRALNPGRLIARGMIIFAVIGIVVAVLLIVVMSRASRPMPWRAD